jgi:hypothetical protein
VDPKRLVKVVLPSKLVDSMDEAIERHPGYDDRSAFVADAVASLVAELEVGGPDEVGRGRTGTTARPAPAPTRYAAAQPTWPDEQAYLLSEFEPPQRRLPMHLPDVALTAPAAGIVVTPQLPVPAEQLTWGMHNRDWPTLWAASELGRVSTRGPVDFEPWVAELITRAWDIAQMLLGDSWDLSGLPMNPEKSKRSAGRFRAFFVGDSAGDGPLFSLGLAVAVRADAILLTKPGVDLLQQLAGLEPRRARVRGEWRAAFLAHLAAWVPEDFAFLRRIVALIDHDRATRFDLLEAVEAEHRDWKESVVATNVAGFIARGREWDLIEPQQSQRRYAIVPDAPEALDEAAEAGERARAEYE